MSFILNRIISKLQKNMEDKDLSSTDSKNWGGVPAQVQDARQFLTARPTTFDLRRK